MLFIILQIAAGIVSIVCWIMVIVAFFKNDEIGHGVVSILCGFWGFIMGWVKAGEYGLMNVMVAWTCALIVQVVIGILMGAATASQAVEIIQPVAY